MDTQLIILLTQALQSSAETNRYMANLLILNTRLVAAGIIMGIGGLLLLAREVRQVARLLAFPIRDFSKYTCGLPDDTP